MISLTRKLERGFSSLDCLWVVHGDKNSKYFHSRAVQRLRRNHIDGIRDSTWQWCSDLRRVANEVLKFYSSLFSSPHTCQPEMALDSTQSIVIDDMNRQPSTDFLESEVQVVLSQMATLKALGLDGMPPLFY